MRTWICLILGLVLSQCREIAANEPHPDLRTAIRLSTEPYNIAGKWFYTPFDRDAFTRLMASTSPHAREIATLRLGIEELRNALQAEGEEAKQAIAVGTTIAAPIVSAAIIENAILQLADGDDSIERQFSDAVGVVQSFEGLRQHVLEKQIACALIGYSGQLADHQLRQKLIETISPQDASAETNVSFTPGWAPRPEIGAEVFRVKNTTGRTLHNALIVVDLAVNKQLVDENEAAQMILLSGLSLWMGIDPQQDNKFVLIRQASRTVNGGGSAFIEEWLADQSVEFPVSDIGMFISRTESATLAISSDELAFTGRGLSIKSAVAGAQKRIEAFQLKAREDAQKAARKAAQERLKAQRRRRR